MHAIWRTNQRTTGDDVIDDNILLWLTTVGGRQWTVVAANGSKWWHAIADNGGG